MQSALYMGWVYHQRIRPSRHRLRYRGYWLLLDLDELETAARRLRTFSYNRSNILSFYDQDYGERSSRALRSQIEEHLRTTGLPDAGHHIRLLCMPRVLGYVFNPLSIYFCHGRDGELAAVIYEVTNTFGERHSYLIPRKPSPDPIVRQRCDKQFYVSPFLDMEMSYDFRLTKPEEALSLSVLGSNAEGPIIFASMKARRFALSDANLLRAACTHPLLTQKVIGAIHWEALRLWAKGLKLRPRPGVPEMRVTSVCPHPRVRREEDYV